MASTDTVQIGDGFLDVKTSLALWTQVYQAPKELIQLGNWFDRASFGIPYTYTVTGYMLAEALKSKGQTKEAASIMTQVTDMAKAARLTDVLASLGDRSQ